MKWLRLKLSSTDSTPLSVLLKVPIPLTHSDYYNLKLGVGEGSNTRVELITL